MQEDVSPPARIQNTAAENLPEATATSAEQNRKTSPGQQTPSSNGRPPDLVDRLTIQRLRNEAAAAKWELQAVLKQLKRQQRQAEQVPSRMCSLAGHRT